MSETASIFGNYTTSTAYLCWMTAARMQLFCCAHSPGSAPEPTGPGSNQGPDLARYRAPATDKVRNCRSCKRGMQWEDMGRVQDAGWVAGVTCKIATMALKILVEAPGFRCSSSCSQKCRIGWHCSHPGRLMDDADQLGASHGSCKRAIESSATTIIN